MSAVREKRKAMYAAAAERLREARDRMNHRGVHWIKGAEKRFVDPTTHEPGDPGYHYTKPRGKGYGHFEPAFCSIGSLRAGKATGRDMAMIELARIIDPEAMKAAEEEAREEALEESEHGVLYLSAPWTEDEIDDFVYRHLLNECEVVIPDFNDSSLTSWEDVRSAFTRAAKRLADRARA